MDHEKTISPSFPSNYVTLVQLQERWLKEKERKRREEGEEDPRPKQKGEAAKVVAESKPPSSSTEVGEDDKKMKTPSFPSNYVTLVQLQARWVKEKERKQREEGEGDRRLKEKELRDGAADVVKVVAESKAPSRSPETSAQVEVACERATETATKKRNSKQTSIKKGKSQRELNPPAQDAVAGKEVLGELPFSNAEKDRAGGATRGEIRAEISSLEAYSRVSSSNSGFGRGGRRKRLGRRKTAVEAGEARFPSHNLETKSRVFPVNVVIREDDERLSRRNDCGGDKEDEPVGKIREKGRDKGKATSDGNVQSMFKSFPGNGEIVRNSYTRKRHGKGKGISRETQADSEIPKLKAEIEPVRDFPENGVAGDGDEDSAWRGKKQIGFVRKAIGDTELGEPLPVRCGAGKRNDRAKEKGMLVIRNEEGVVDRVETGAGSEISDLTAEIEPNLRAFQGNGLSREGIEEWRKRGKKQDMFLRKIEGETKPTSDALDHIARTKHQDRALPVNGRAGKRNVQSRMEDVSVSRNEERVGGKVKTRAASEGSDLTADIESGLSNLPVNSLAWEGNKGLARRDKKQQKLARQTGGETKPESNVLNPTTSRQEVRAFPVSVGAGKRNEGSRKKGVQFRRNVESKAESANSDQLVGVEPKFEVFSTNIAAEEANIGFSRNARKEESPRIGFEKTTGSESSDPTADIEPGLQALPIEESGRRGKNQDMFWRKTRGETKPKRDALDQMAGTEQKVYWAGRRTKAGYGRGFRESQSFRAGRFHHKGVSHRSDSGSRMVWVKKDDLYEGFWNQIGPDSD